MNSAESRSSKHCGYTDLFLFCCLQLIHDRLSRDFLFHAFLSNARCFNCTWVLFSIMWCNNL